MAYMSDCLIELSDTHTITFGYQRHFSDNLPSSYILREMSLIVYFEYKVNIKTRVASVNTASSSSRNTALTERKKLQYSTLSLYIERIKNPCFYIIRRTYLSLNTLRGSETTLKPVLKNKNLLKLQEA